MKRLRIYAAAETEWALFENKAILQSGTGESFPPCDACEVIVPAAMVLLTRAILPRANRKRLAEIAAFAVEESVIPDPESNHVVTGPTFPDGTTLLAVIDKAWMKSLLGRLSASGLEPERMLAESLLPDLQPGNWALVLDASGGFLKTGEHAAHALDCHEHEPPLGLKLALQQASPPAGIVVHAGQFPDLDSWSRILGIPCSKGDAWDWRRAEGGTSLDLLHGEFSRKMEAIDWRPFRPALFMLFLMAVLQLGGIVYGWASLSHEKKMVFSEMDRLFRASFPEAAVVVDAPLQMKRKLDDLRRSNGSRRPGDFLPLLESVAHETAALPPGSLSSINYAADGMDLGLEFPNDAALRSFRNRLEASGVKTSLKKVSAKGSGIAAEVHVGAGVS